MGILVTGGCGYIGTRLTEALLARTDEAITVIDTAWFGNYLPSSTRLTFFEADLRAPDTFDLRGVHTIFHLAGIANDPSAELDPSTAWDINVLGTMQLADRAARENVKQFIFASSGAVYGVRSEPSVTESLDLTPISVYNKTKMVAERVVQSYQDRFLATVIRPATVCGLSPRMRLDLTVNLLTMQALASGRMTVFGGSQVRPNIHIDDLVDLYMFVYQRRISGVFNAAFENLTVLEIAETIARHVPSEILVNPDDADPRSYRLCSDRLLQTGFSPRKNVAAAVVELARAYKRGALVDQPNWHTVNWMKQHNFA